VVDSGQNHCIIYIYTQHTQEIEWQPYYSLDPLASIQDAKSQSHSATKTSKATDAGESTALTARKPVMVDTHTHPE
jgi:hypothetical protein